MLQKVCTYCRCFNSDLFLTANELLYHQYSMQLHQLEQEVIFFSYLVFLNINWKILLKKMLRCPAPAPPVINKCNGSTTFSKTEFICFILFLTQWHTILNVLRCLKFNEHSAFRKSSSSTWTDAICCGPPLQSVLLCTCILLASTAKSMFSTEWLSSWYVFLS